MELVTINELVNYVMDHIAKDDNNVCDTDTTIRSEYKPMDKLEFSLLNYEQNKPIIDFPKNLKNLFDPFLNNIIRIGTCNPDNNLVTRSLLYNTLYLIDDKFVKLPYNKQIDKVEKFKKSLINYIYSTNFYCKDLGWNKKLLIDDVSKYNNSEMILRLLCDYIYINIFIVNIKDDKLYCMYSEKEFNKFKPNIFLSFYADHFEPLIYLDSISDSTLNTTDATPSPKNNKASVFYIKQNFIKKLFNVSSNKIRTYNPNFLDGKPKQFIIGNEDLLQYLETQRIEEKKVNEHKNDLAQKKITELQELAKKHDVDIYNGTYKNGTNKPKTKNALIKDLKKIDKL